MKSKGSYIKISAAFQKINSFLSYLFILPFVLIGCHTDAKPKIHDHVIVYEVFIQSFCDSNGDGIGDLPPTVELTPD